jgi:hypothetical protein
MIFFGVKKLPKFENIYIYILKEYLPDFYKVEEVGRF